MLLHAPQNFEVRYIPEIDGWISCVLLHRLLEFGHLLGEMALPQRPQL